MTATEQGMKKPGAERQADILKVQGSSEETSTLMSREAAVQDKEEEEKHKRNKKSVVYLRARHERDPS